MKYFCILFALLMIVSCNKEEEEMPLVNISKIGISNGEFRDAEGSPFFPWGLNYTNPKDVGLIEDNWLDEGAWEIIKSDFLEMKSLGANVVRIHLQYHQFMSDASTPDPIALNRLDDLVRYVESQKLYLDITGLAAYEKGSQPSYYDSMTDEERWNTHKIFWKSVAATVGASPAVFAFNLMNEPVVSVGCDMSTSCHWLPGPGLGGFHFVQNITRTPGKEFQLTLESWIAEITEAIRSEDSETMITVGFLDLGLYSRFADDLDYLSPHIYPRSGELQVSADRVFNNQSNVPLLIEEISNFNCTITELQEFLDSIDGAYDGLMGHYFGIPLEELDVNNINQALQKNFLEFFVDNNPN